MKRLFKKTVISIASIFSFLFAFLLVSSVNIEAASPHFYAWEYKENKSGYSATYQAGVALNSSANVIELYGEISSTSTITNNVSNTFYVDVDETDFGNLNYESNIHPIGTYANRYITVYFYFSDGVDSLNEYMNSDSGMLGVDFHNVLQCIAVNVFTSDDSTVSYTFSNLKIRGLGYISSSSINNVTNGSAFSITNFSAGCSFNYPGTTLTSRFNVIPFDDLLNSYTQEDIDSARQEAFEEGKASVDITVNDEEVYNNGFQAGVDSVDITADNQEVYDQGFSDGQISVDITSNDEAIYNEAYKEGNDDGYTVGFQDGKNSVDISAIEEEAYNHGYSDGYNVGYIEGEYSVDITTDNDKAIDIYLSQNKLYTQSEYDLNFEFGIDAGIAFVYNNIETDEVVKEYVEKYITENKYYTETEYITKYEEGKAEGKEEVYENLSTDSTVQEYWETKLVNNTKIQFVEEGKEVVKLVKNYDTDIDNNGDTTITIHYGQDNYKIITETVTEVIPGEGSSSSDSSTITDSSEEEFEFPFDAVIGIVATIILIVIVLIIIASAVGGSKKKTIIKMPERKYGKKRGKLHAYKKEW